MRRFYDEAFGYYMPAFMYINKFEKLNYIMKICGAPNIVDDQGDLMQGAFLNGKEINAEYMSAPFAINELVTRQDKECPFTDVCRRGNHNLYTIECEFAPLKKVDEKYMCPIMLFAKLYSLN